MSEVTATLTEIKKKSVCIVKFGPVTPTDGLRPAEYYQVTVDPDKVSESGKFIRFGMNQGDEIQGWQRAEAITIVEVLAEWNGDEPPTMYFGNGVTMFVAD